MAVDLPYRLGQQFHVKGLVLGRTKLHKNSFRRFNMPLNSTQRRFSLACIVAPTGFHKDISLEQVME